MVTRRALMTSATAALLTASRSRPSRAADATIPLAIVVAKSSAIADLSFHELKRLYLGEQTRSSDGTKFIPLNQAGRSEDRIGFERTVLGMLPDEVSRYWIDRKIRGQSGAPKSLDSVDVLRRVVGRIDGAVGYVRATDVTSELRTLRIDGKAPGEPGYRIAY